MAIKVTLTNKAQQTTFSGKEAQDGNLRINRLIYQRLASLTQNKTIATATDIPKELLELFDEFDKIMTNQTNGNNLIEVSAEAEAIDEYLGTLGISDEYMYEKDKIDLTPWITIAEQNPIRNVIVSWHTDYNVIVSIEGVNYNVVHNSSELTTGVQNGR